MQWRITTEIEPGCGHQCIDFVSNLTFEIVSYYSAIMFYMSDNRFSNSYPAC
jgi:hypothetical protein